MADETKKIAYLFGAGATHSELQALNPPLDPNKSETWGLLTSNVSDRVITKANKNELYLKDIKTISGAVSGYEETLNIELLISLIEHSKVNDWATKTDLLKDLVKDDITSVLTKPK